MSSDNTKLKDFFVSDEEWGVFQEAEWQKNLRWNLDRCYGIAFGWRDGLHTDGVVYELMIDRSKTLKLLNQLEEDGIISQSEEGWWKAEPPKMEGSALEEALLDVQVMLARARL